MSSLIQKNIIWSDIPNFFIHSVKDAACKHQIIEQVPHLTFLEESFFDISIFYLIFKEKRKIIKVNLNKWRITSKTPDDPQILFLEKE